jgi:drug/metabolite transporter (DMT)-like permease
VSSRSAWQNLRATLLTSLAMLAFAGNSVLCRMALKDGAIDPSSFTSIRIAAGAATLLLIAMASTRQTGIRSHGSWWSAAMLFTYAIAFSYAYVTLSTGTGALILFGFVQATMIAWGLASGDRPGIRMWIGWSMAVAGLVWLLMPGIEAPSAAGAVLMAAAGVAWGLYSLRGRSISNPLLATTANFALSMVFVAGLIAMTAGSAWLTTEGVLLAIVSGALTSGLGYVTWYAALENLSPTSAALVQLSVPAIAAAGGVILLGEPLTIRLLASAALVLGGIAIALRRKST